MDKEQFKTLRYGSRVYRYIDSKGKKGSWHFAKNELTPVRQIVSDDKTYVNLDGQYFEINNMQELDIIDNALNNHEKYLQKVLQTPSSVIAQNNPDLYKKVLFAVRSSAIFNSDPYRTKRAKVNGIYEELDLIAKKLNKIDREIAKSKSSKTIQER